MRVHLVDGTYELFRHFFAVPSHRDLEGREVGAARAVVGSLVALLEEGATHVGVATDHVIESFRNDLFDGYKTGAGIDPELCAQFETAEELVRALGIVCWPMVEFEADDALATAAARFAHDPSVEQVRIVSPDKDLAQCVRGDRVVCVDVRREIVLDEAGVWEKFGVAPSSIPDYLGLVGDTADGIPGVPRWGARSSAALLAEYGSIEAIPDDHEMWSVQVRGARSLASELLQHRDDLRLYKDLATLRLDVPLEEGLSDLAWNGPDFDALAELCESLGDKNLLGRARS